jgi:hypothetical protein
VTTQEARATALWAAANAAGAGEQVPHPQAARADIDEMLAASSTPVDREEVELRRLLGVL